MVPGSFAAFQYLVADLQGCPGLQCFVYLRRGYLQIVCLPVLSGLRWANLQDMDRALFYFGQLVALLAPLGQCLTDLQVCYGH